MNDYTREFFEAAVKELSTRDNWRSVECAYGLANLRWINQDKAGLQPHLEFTAEEVRQWLIDRRTFQPSLFEVAHG